MQAEVTTPIEVHARYGVPIPQWRSFVALFRDSAVTALPDFLEPTTAWIVVSGTVDVFAEIMGEAGLTGIRQHVFRAEASDVLFGMDIPTEKNIRLAVRPLPDSDLVPVPMRALRELASQQEYTLLVSEVLDRWVRLIGTPVTPPVAPKSYTLITSPNYVVNPGENVRGTGPSSWVEMNSGAAYYIGRTDFNPIKAGSYIPLPPWAWLQGTESWEACLHNSANVIASHADWGFLSTFHNFVLTELLRQAESAYALESTLISEKVAYDEATTQAAIDKLAGAWHVQSHQDDISDTDPLLAACQIVGAAMGITLRPPIGADLSLLSNPVMEIARGSGVGVREVRLRGRWWEKQNGPLLAFRGTEAKPVALLRDRTGKYHVRSGLSDQDDVVTAENAYELGTQAYMFYRPLPEHALGARDLFKFIRPVLLSNLSVLLTAGIVGAALSLLSPILLGFLLENLIPNGAQDGLLLLFVVLLVSAGAQALFQLISSITLTSLDAQINGSLQAAIWLRVVALPVNFFRLFEVGDLASRAMGMNRIRVALSGSVILSGLSSLFLLINLGLMFFYSPILTLITLGLIFVFGLFSVFLLRNMLQSIRTSAMLDGKLSGTIMQILSGINRLRLSGAEVQAYKLWADRFSAQRIATFRRRVLDNRLGLLLGMLPTVASIAVFAIGYSQVQATLSIGEFVAFYNALGIVLAGAVTLVISISHALTAIPAYERMQPILESLPEVSEVKKHPGELTGRIDVDHVSFRYAPDQPLVLNDINFSVNRGEFVALVGASGSGKSSLLRLLIGFEQPELGVVAYDGQPLVDLDLQAVRRQIGTVLQHGQLMAGDIYTNIVGTTMLTVEDAWEAARLAGFDDDIRAMPMGMYTYINEGGSTFSGGQRQRLLIARALATRPRIIFFDEATSALDDQNQAIVMESLQRMDATRIVIAHRLSTIVNADRILVMDRGRLVETGTYKELMDKNGLFARLVRRQLL